MSHPDLAGIATDEPSRQRRLRSFIARVQQDDDEMVAFWRDRSSAEHAAAGAHLSDLAARMAVQTGRAMTGPLEFPPLSSLRARGKRPQ